MKELQATIEKLKDPKQAQPFWLRSKEEQKILKDAAPDGCLYTDYTLYPACSQSVAKPNEMNQEIYILKPYYQPQLEYEDIEVIVEHSILYLKKYIPCTILRTIDAAPRSSRFVGFFVDPDTDGERSIILESVATVMWDKHKVIVRFRKE